MAVNMKIAGLITIGLAAALAGAYQIGRTSAVASAAALQLSLIHISEPTRPY